VEDPLRVSERRLLDTLPRQQRLAGLTGLALCVLGVAYVGWAVSHFEPRSDPRDQVSFDTPITRRVVFLYHRYQQRLEAFEARTPRESALVKGLRRNMSFSSGLLVLAFRVLLGTLAVMLGLASLTVVVERRRLLHIVARLEGRDP
jgi:hypothetical protein